MLTIAKEVSSKHPLPLLDINYRRRQLAFRRSQISQWLTNEQEQLREEAESSKAQGQPLDEEYIATRVSNMEKEASRQESDALGMYGMLEGNDPSIAPLRRALAVWGLTADDIGVLSIHGTSTKANVCFFLLSIHTSISHRFHRKRMRLIFGTRYCRTLVVLQAMLFPSWPKRVFLVTQKVAPLLGKCLVYLTPSTLA